VKARVSTVALRGGGLRRLLRFLRVRLRVETRWLVLGVLLLVIANLLGLSIPLVLQQVVDRFSDATTDSLQRSLQPLIVLLLVVFTLQTLVEAIRTYLFAALAERFVCRLQIDLYDHLQALPLAYFGTARTGELTAGFLASIGRMRRVVSSDLTGFLRHVVVLSGSVALMLVLNWRLTLLALAGLVIVGLLISALLRFVERTARQAQRQVAVTTGIVEEALSNVAVIRAFVRERYESLRIAGALEQARDQSLRRDRVRLLLLPVSNIVGFTTMVLVLLFGVRQVASGDVTAGGLIAYLVYVGLLVSSAGGLSDALGRLSDGAGSIDEVLSLLDQPVDQPSRPRRPLVAFSGSLLLERVTFVYPRSEAPVLQDVSLAAEPGKVIAVVGPSGSGKSTLIQLILGLRRPTAGEIYFDGQPLSDLDVATVRRQLAVVFQEPCLFAATLRENIRYGRLEATDAEIERAAARARVEEFLDQLPLGFETPLGPRGGGLSAGQQQRVALARAFLRQPALLILDEATSALDGRNERAVQDAVEELMTGRTTLLVAHRMATVKRADAIIVLDRGVCVETGVHEELLAQRGLYWQLCQQQRLDVVDYRVGEPSREALAL
jgi:ATP-binding cassette, subfamily B, bacterial MsbA